MDWPLIGAVAGAVTICGVVAVGGVALLQSPGAPAQKATPAAAVRLFPSGGSGIVASPKQSMLVPSGSSAMLSPAAPPQPPISPFALATASPSDLPADQTSDQSGRLAPNKPAAWDRRTEAPSYALRQTPSESGRPLHWQEAKADPYPVLQAPKAPPGGLKVPVQPGSGIQQIGPPQWRAVATAKASYFNLGGHLDRNGVVDALASQHLREAFKSHRNYPKLPPHAKALIEAQNINLSRLAPFRALLGINDRVIEEEQAVRFERVASTRGGDTTGAAGSSYRGIDGDPDGATEEDAIEPIVVAPGEFEPLVIPPFK